MFMALPALLFALPLVTALVLLVNRNPAVRNTLVRVSALLMAALSVAVGVMYFGHPFKIGVDSPLVRLVMMAVDGLAALTVLYFCVKYKRYLTALLGLAQFFLIVAFEFHAGSYARSVWDFNIDNLSIIMILIAGIIGGLIAVYSLGYMAVYHRKHVDVKDRRSFFFFVVFLFLSAMFGLVMCNNLLYMYTFWEITSLCSFLLIGYSGTNEAIHNSFKALWMNLLGGLAFAMAIAYLGEHFYTLEISQLLSMGMQGMPVEPVVALLVFCGFTKSAMMPFSGWLLGAMVAPTPTSALLHSSTMVKAGVFLIIKLAPILGNNHAGIMAMLVGGITFFFASCAAISQSDGKKVLAYSTISNLGLIVCCAGTGSYEAAWTAIMIVIFHAVAKSLLFLTVGTAEQQLGSRNLESFDGIFNSMPRLSLCMVIGICGMFLAPFGMLISKWAAMKAFVDAGQPLLLLALVYGSATTLFYWTKWLGKITTYIPTNENREKGILGVEWTALKTLAALTLVVCVLFPLISQYMVIPYLALMYRNINDVIAQSNLWIMSVMVFLIIILPLRFGKSRRKKQVITNLSGENLGSDVAYRGAAGRIVPVQLRNWYLESWFGERRMTLWGYTACLACVLMELSLAAGGVFHV
ncbi:MAG: proton-conducting transporter membrane subunit [Dialister sp.]|uniref:NADH-quinone oxidoreductase subunit 5 family protein n=1 Tax=Dialister sp. TaxID=1955814 RepID=UPI0025EAF963|nr:proton-conducting transporter membrane subunit [Dialister sp.]MEE0291196.1 proton-conducting transporter membrane subunit [Dialister sp.]